MAIDLKSPTLAAPGLAGGLLLIFLGQRAFGHAGSFGTALTILGLILVVGCAVWQGFGYLSATGERRSVERTKLLCHAAVLIALLVYFTSTDTGMDLLGVAEDGRAKFRTAATVLFAIITGLGIIPLAFIVSSEGFGHERMVGDKANVDLFRVKEMAASGLTIALALAFLMVTCNVASERNIRKDLSYFKTSQPGTSVVNALTHGTTEPLSVIMFFPETNEVGDEVAAYFSELDGKVDGRLDVQRVDRMVRAKLAKDLKVSNDGTIVLKLGDKSENIRLTTDIKRARRNELREFDGKVGKGNAQTAPPQKDRLHLDRTWRVKRSRVERIDQRPQGGGCHKKTIGELNYQVKNFDGLGKPVPDDADVLVVLAPKEALLDVELRAIDDYPRQGRFPVDVA